MKKSRKILIPLSTIMICIGASFLLFDLLDFELVFTDDNIISHYGIFVGFGLTIYTFIISILDSITERVDNVISNERRELVKGDIFSSIQNLKENVRAIFFIFVLHLILDLLQSKSILPHIFDILQQGLFFYSIILLYDISRVLFGISDVSIMLIKHKKP